MSENKFIQHLKGKATAGSVVEIKNQATPASFANMPSGTSNANNVYADVRGNATVVAQGTTNWKLNGANLVLASSVSGDGNDYTGVYSASGAGLWVNATYTFPSTGDPNHPVAMIFNPNTKWVLKLCGDNLLANGANTIDFSLVITIGSSNIITKNFTIAEQANKFCKEFVIDFAESNQALIKAQGTTTMQVQLLCATASATARIYNGMTVFTALQRRVDGETVATDQKTFTDVIQDIDNINDEIDQIHEDIDDLEDYVDDTFVRLDGESIMTGPLKMRASSSFQCAIAPFWDGVGFYKLNSDDSVTLIASIETPDGFVPWVTNTYNIGSSLKKWKNLYLAGKAYISTINNGYDLAVPAKSGTLATKEEVDLAANSGDQLTEKGVWYAKMYSATVAPSAEDGTNYADFSQTDGQGNPIIVIYKRQNGAWVQDQTITPPAEYNGYVTVTSKIWDIVEQSGQQGGKILWSHNTKTFTPYPQIISFENIAVTGNSTVAMPQNPTGDQIVNKNYVDNKVSSSIGNGTITLTQSGNTMGTFTTNQSGDTTIALDGGSSYHPDLFDYKWADHELDDMQWLRADTFSWQSGEAYQAAYQHLLYDIYHIQKTRVYMWHRSTGGHVFYVFTLSATPQVDDTAYIRKNDGTNFFYEPDQAITAVPDSTHITCGGYTYSYDDLSVDGVVAQKETIAGTDIIYYVSTDGHKICWNNQESNVAAIYTATGAAWYYILDTTNQRFKLPRVNPEKATLDSTAPIIFGEQTNTVNYLGDSDPVGQRVASSLSNITSNVKRQTFATGYGTGTDKGCEIYTDLSAATGVFAGKKYLYFYVGNFTQTALENTAGLNTELFNNKVDKGHQVVEFQAPTAENNYTWYRKYADGWVEQGGIKPANTTTVDFPVTMANTEYWYIVKGNYDNTSGSYASSHDYVTTRNTTGFVLSTGGTTACWEVKGMAQG